MKRNRFGLDSWVFRPSVLNDVSEVDISTELLGTPLRMPVMLPPIGSVQVFEAGGGVSVARAAEEFGVMQTLSSVCTPDFEEVARQVPGPRVYQLYLMGDQGWMDDVIRRAIDCGYTGFCLTVDTQTYSRRERDISKGFVPPSGSRSDQNDFGYQARITHVLATYAQMRMGEIDRQARALRAVMAEYGVIQSEEARQRYLAMREDGDIFDAEARAVLDAALGVKGV